MAELITLQTLLTYLTLISIPVGVFYYISTLRNQNRARQAQLLMQIVNQWSQPIMVDARGFYAKMELSSFDDFLKLWRDPESERMLRIWGGFIEGIGVLVRENYLDIKAIAGLMGSNIKNDWEKQAPYIAEFRERWTPRSWIEWEYLYNVLMKYAEEHPERSIQAAKQADIWRTEAEK